MSRATMSRANFKKYTDITNPLASKEDSSRLGISHDVWRDSDNSKPSQAKKGRKEEEEEEDPFGLGSIMSKAAEDNDQQQQEEDEEEEDPFGLGAIMDGAKQKTDNQTSQTGSGKRSNDISNSDDGNGDEARSKKSKTTAADTTGGYFIGTQSSTPGESALAEAKRQPFRAATCFGGAHQGYVFQKGPLGLGYYADSVQLRAAAAAAAVVAASRESGQVPEARGASNLSATAAAGVSKGDGRTQKVDVAASLQKLKVFILKAKKAAKAASLMADLMEAQMSPDNARMFFRALKPLAEEPAGDAAIAAGEGAARAFRLLMERASEWVAAPAEGVRAVTWELLFGLRHDMRTDDSFTFARAIKRLRQAIEALGDVTGGGKATDGMASESGQAGDARVSLSLERKTAIVLIMKEAFKSYHLAWARSSIEPAFKAAADRRRLFPEGELRETLDSFTDAITRRQRNPGGLMAPPSRSIRAHNSTAHPMLNKRSDVIR